MDKNPFQQFHVWYEEAKTLGLKNTNAIALATVDAGGMPNVRMVLLKQYDENGLVWFTNYQGTKGKELIAHPEAALVLYWEAIGKQIRVRGAVTQTNPAESDAYFASRPRRSQLAAWASSQSQVIPSREYLEARVEEFGKKYPDTVPRPDYWGGFRMAPQSFEFWQDQKNRLHDRFFYTKDSAGAWKIERLSP